MAIQINRDGDKVKVTFDYDPDLVEICRSIPGRKYSKEERANYFPKTSVREVIESFPLATVSLEVRQLDEELLKYSQTINLVDTSIIDELPMANKLRQYQREDIVFMYEHPFMLNALEMGLGKTLEAIAVVLLSKAKKVLVVCPNTVKTVWADEIEKWSDYPYLIIEGDKKQRLRLWEKDSVFYIVNYESARLHVPEMEEIDWDIVIVDEAHRIKNRQAKQTKAVKSIEARRKILLSGTPIMNRAEEIWSLLNYLNPVEYANYWKFQKRYCIMGGFESKEVVGYKNSVELKEKIHEVMIRRRKDEVLKELPPRIYQNLFVDLDAKQRKLYDKAEEEIILELEKEEGKTGKLRIWNALSRMIRLKQIAISPRLVGDIGPSAKFNELSNLLEEIITDGHKVIVYSQFKMATDMLRDMFGKCYNAAYVSGDVDPEDRGKEIKKFQEDDSCKLFIGTIGSCKEGITLTAATYVVFLDKDWVPANNEQAIARAVRIGQNNTVNVISLIGRNTVEEGIERILAKKQQTFDNFVEINAPIKQETFTYKDLRTMLRTERRRKK